MARRFRRMHPPPRREPPRGQGVGCDEWPQAGGAVRGTASSVGCEREGGEVDGQVDVSCSGVDLVGEPLLLVNGLLELRQPVAPAHALGASKDLLAPPQQLRTWLVLVLVLVLVLGLGLGVGVGPPKQQRTLTPRVLRGGRGLLSRRRLALGDDGGEARRQVGAIERVKEAAIDAQALRHVYIYTCVPVCARVCVCVVAVGSSGWHV